MSTLDVISGHLSEIKIALKNGQFNENSVSELSNVMSKISSLICIMANDLEKPCSIMAQKWDEIELELEKSGLDIDKLRRGSVVWKTQKESDDAIMVYLTYNALNICRSMSPSDR